MAKKMQKLKPDTVLKNYWSNNEQFADLFNAVLFEGKQIIKPDELEEIVWIGKSGVYSLCNAHEGYGA